MKPTVNDTATAMVWLGFPVQRVAAGLGLVCGRKLLAGLAIFGFVISSTLCLQTQADDVVGTSDQLEFFEKEIRPLFATHCYGCHSVDAEKIQAGLLMDSRDGLLKGGDSGEAIVPGDANGSLLVEAVRYESYEMPPSGKLPQKDIQAIERWVQMGAPWPKETEPTAEVVRPEFNLQQRKVDHWVWQPIRQPSIPDVMDTAWPRDPLDRFVLAKLEEAKLKPAGDTDRAALMRRLYFDLIGLPPTVEQSTEFLSDTTEGATERLVDQLLDSPHFGERWGRHWLDLVRYAESRGHEFDNDAPNASQYRDYVIRAFNKDVPYDQLVREHIAGDLLAEPRLHSAEGFNESILGTGFWFLGEWVHSPVDIRKDEADRFDNMIDVMSKTFLGVTVSCARCHDHKFDAISTADYYSLSGFLQSSDYRQVRFESIEHNQRIAKQLAQLDQGYQRQLKQLLTHSGDSLSASDPLSAGELKLEALKLEAMKLEAMKPEAMKLEAMPAELAQVVVFDFSKIPANDFTQDGFIFGLRPRLVGDAYLETIQGKPQLGFSDVSAAVSDSFWDGLTADSESNVQDRSSLAKVPRSGRTLRTPTFELANGTVACRVRGTGHVVACVDSHRLIAGPLHAGTVKPIQGDQAWVELNLNRYVGHRLHLEFTPAEGKSLEVMLVTQGASEQLRKQWLERESQFSASVKNFQQAAVKLLGERADEMAQAWMQERAKLQATIMLRSRLAMAMMDGTGEDDRVLIRGNSSKPGQVEPRHFLTAVTGNQPVEIGQGSGRLELAAQINDPANPLTSRVIVNRIWHYLMGRGIVPTTDDFGVLGQRPSHPELLDHLAIRFQDDGRSIKRMIRSIVVSRSYQMSSQSNMEAVAIDPKNALWHYRPPKRLEGEAIRDSLLLLSGELDPTQFGEPIPIHLTAFMDGRGRPGQSGPLDGAGRRSIYTAVRRNFLSPFMLTFDTPSPFSTMGRRNVSNVPAQALILMNDPFVVDQAQKWAKVAIENDLTVPGRIQWMYESAFARRPTQPEATIALEYLKLQSEEGDSKQNELQSWTNFAHALINTKEFIFLR